MNRYERIYDTVANDPVLTGLGLQKVYRSTGAIDPSEDCFAVLAWAQSNPTLPEVPDAPQTLTVWLYAAQGLDLIDDMLPRVRALITSLAGADGVSQARWLGDSGDLYDDRWVKDTRNATFEVH